MLLCAGLAAAAFYVSTLPTRLTIAVGPPNSEDVRLVHAMATQLLRDHSNIRLNTIVIPGGTREAMTALDNGTADLAVVRHDTGMPKEGQVVAILRKNVAVFIVPSAPNSNGKTAEVAKPAAKKKAAAKDEEEEEEPAKPAAKKASAKKTGAKKTAAKKSAPAAKDAAAKPEAITKIEELVGRRLGVVGRGPNNIDLLKVILRQYNIAPDKIAILSGDAIKQPNAPDKVNVVQFDPSNVVAAIRESHVDAILSVGPVGSTITANAIAAATRGKEPPTFLALNAAEAIAERSPIYKSTEIKAGAFGGAPPRPEEDTETIGVNHYIVARKSLSEATVADFTQQLFAMRQLLAVDIPSASKIETPSTDKDAAVSVHPGAAAYIDGEVKTFFDRYSDLLYLGLMLFSFAGSALVGLASYSKAGDRARRLEALEKLMEIAKSARTAETLQRVDELQSEVDAIQSEMICEVESSSLDASALAGFSISFEQTWHAISERRAALTGQPPRPLAAVSTIAAR